jgi:type II secretory pathway component PulJ
VSPGGVRASRAAAGFTLIEVVAAVFLTAVVLGLALSIYVYLSDATLAAQARTRDGRHALAILDRVARDLQGAYLLAKPPELDPLFHPWIFLAENHTESEGADRVKFVTRNHRPRNPLGHGSDLAVVSYVLEHGDHDRFVLTRSLSPGLPEELDREFHTADDERAMVVADRIASFAMRFLDDEQQWQNEWDSSLIEESSDLPLAAEIEVSLAPIVDDEEDFEELDPLDPEQLEHFTRRVLLPVRPIDLELMMAAASGATEPEDEDDEDEDDDEGSGGEDSAGETLRECLAEQGLLGVAEEEFPEAAQYLDRPASDPVIQVWLSSFGASCE